MQNNLISYGLSNGKELINIWLPSFSHDKISLVSYEKKKPIRQSFSLFFFYQGWTIIISWKSLVF